MLAKFSLLSVSVAEPQLLLCSVLGSAAPVPFLPQDGTRRGAEMRTDTGTASNSLLRQGKTRALLQQS